MARTKKELFFDRLVAQAIVPVFSSPDHDVNCRVLECCARAGIELFEFTDRVPDAVNLFRKLREYSRMSFPDVFLGIGTVRREDTARQYLEAKAQFIVGPNFSPEIALLCTGTVPYSPGCATPTELEAAQECLGETSVLKVFPGNVLGPAFVRAVRATNPSLRLMVTGGVKPSEESLREWFSSGAAAVGMGSELIRKEAVAERDWKSIHREVLAALTLAAEIKEELR